MTKVNIIGAGGHTRSLISIIEERDWLIIGIFDDSFQIEEKEEILGYKLIGIKEKSFEENIPTVLSIGDGALREELFKSHGSFIMKDNIISNYALIGKDVIIGQSNQIFPHVYINSEAVIGDNNIINSKALIEHESIIGNHCHISVGAIICGRVTIGDSCFIGAGAVVKDKISICSNVTIGLGAIVVKDIDEPGVYIGNPLKKIK